MTVFNAYTNQLSSLPKDLFAGLSFLHTITLNDNSITAIPVGLLSSCGASLVLFRREPMREIPSGAFNGLTNATIVKIAKNSISALTANMFSDMRRLTSLQMDVNV